MKMLLWLAITTLFLVEEPSYNFGGNYTKDGNVRLIIDVQDGDYWVKFIGKQTSDASPYVLSEKARVKKGNLHIRIQQGKKAIVMIISPADHTRKMVVRGLNKADQYSLMHLCPEGDSLPGDYTRIQ